MHVAQYRKWIEEFSVLICHKGKFILIVVEKNVLLDSFSTTLHSMRFPDSVFYNLASVDEKCLVIRILLQSR